MNYLFKVPCTVKKIEKGNIRVLKRFEKEAAIDEIVRLTSTGHPMPALGVSLHEETLQDMKVSDYLIFEFETAQEFEGYSFEALALKQTEDKTGLQFLRRQNGRWEGRCLYWQSDARPIAAVPTIKK